MSYMLIVLASAASATLAFGQPLIAHELDLAVVAGSYMLVSAVGGLVFGGSMPRGWSLFKGLRGALRAVWLRIPVPLALVTAVMAGGNMRVQDLVASQGVAPWSWAVFTNPVLSIAAILLLAVGTIRLEPDQPLLRPAESARGARLAMALDAFHIMVVAHLGAILFMGGWRLPVGGELGMIAGGAFLVQIKAWLVAAVVLTVRWAVPQLSASVVVGIWTRVVVPVSVLVACLAAAWGTRALTLSALEPLFGIASFAAAAALCFVFALRVRRLSRGSAALHVNPWL
jgi:NADH:ubiquinone oxidoreductase subunit H